VKARSARNPAPAHGPRRAAQRFGPPHRASRETIVSASREPATPMAADPIMGLVARCREASDGIGRPFRKPALLVRWRPDPL